MAALAPTAVSQRECRHCIHETIHPGDDPRPPALFFLDVDGVMLPLDDELRDEDIDATGRTLNIPGRSPMYINLVASAKYFHPTALESFHSLIEKVEEAGHRVLVVLSSNWKKHASVKEFREEIFSDHFFAERLCCKTSSAGAREREIRLWLKDHGFDSQCKNFLVLDDLFLGSFGSQLIHIHEKDAFLQPKHVEQGLETLGLTPHRV